MFNGMPINRPGCFIDIDAMQDRQLLAEINRAKTDNLRKRIHNISSNTISSENKSSSYKKYIKAEIPFDKPKIKSVMYLSGLTFTGEFFQDQFHGQGILNYPNGSQYIGEINQGQRHGKGVLRYANGNIYEGEFLKDQTTGRGKLTTLSTGICYEGEFLVGHKHGKGMEMYPDGTRFEGTYANNARNGVGTYFFPNGSGYQALYMDNLTYGDIIYTNSDGSICIGKFSEIMENRLAKYVINTKSRL